MEAMTQAEYARHRGVSREAIGKAIKSGKIPESAFRYDDGKRLIDPAAADFALGKNIERVSVREEDDSDPQNIPPRYLGGSGASHEGSGLTKAKTATEVYRARLAELEYNQKVGRVLAVDDVRQAMEKCAAAIVREIEQLPNHADEIASALSQDGIQGMRKVLKGVARQVRTALEREMRLTAVEDQNTREQCSS